MKITIDIPDGMRCVDERMKRCKLCAYAEHMQACNCRLYGRLLKGGKIPVKCPEWISVEGRKPEDNGDVLICVRGRHLQVGFYINERWINYALIKGHVTHWMPLPGIPKEE